jgi:hypothetical protein
MNTWLPLATRRKTPAAGKAGAASTLSVDAAFAELDDLTLRVDAGTERGPSATTSELLSSLRNQLAALEAQREQLSKLVASLPHLPR